MPVVMRVDELEPGMCLAANVMNMYSILLPHGHHLSADDIASLQRKFPDLAVKIGNPVLDEVVSFQDDTRDYEVAKKVRNEVSKMTQQVTEKVRCGVALSSDQIAGMEEAIEEMIAYLQDNPVTMAVLEQSASWDDYLREHSANVFYLSMLIGNTIRNYIRRERERFSAAKNLPHGMNLTPLGAAAMFHDIGMAPLSELYRKEEPLTDAEIAAVRQHPVTGAEILPDSIDPMVRLVVRSHHENIDSSGYPEQLPADRICIFARIIRVADAYSSAIADKVYASAKSPLVVASEMLHGAYRRCYDPVVLKVFGSIIQPFPIGAKLGCADGSSAVVARHNPSDCFNPEVILAFDAFGDPIMPEQLRPPVPLRDAKDFQVVSYDNQDISFIRQLPTDTGDDGGELMVSALDEHELFSHAYP